MRDKIRLPVDVELSTKLVALESCTIEGPVTIKIETEKGAKFNKVLKISISLRENENAIVIVPKSRQKPVLPPMPKSGVTVTERKVAAPVEPPNE